MLEWNEAGVSQSSVSSQAQDGEQAGGEIIRSHINSLGKGAVSWTVKIICRVGWG